MSGEGGTVHEYPLGHTSDEHVCSDQNSSILGPDNLFEHENFPDEGFGTPQKKNSLTAKRMKQAARCLFSDETDVVASVSDIDCSSLENFGDVMKAFLANIELQIDAVDLDALQSDIARIQEKSEEMKRRFKSKKDEYVRQEDILKAMEDELEEASEKRVGAGLGTTIYSEEEIAREDATLQELGIEVNKLNSEIEQEDQVLSDLISRWENQRETVILLEKLKATIQSGMKFTTDVREKVPPILPNIDIDIAYSRRAVGIRILHVKIGNEDFLREQNIELVNNLLELGDIFNSFAELVVEIDRMAAEEMNLTTQIEYYDNAIKDLIGKIEFLQQLERFSSSIPLLDEAIIQKFRPELHDLLRVFEDKKTSLYAQKEKVMGEIDELLAIRTAEESKIDQFNSDHPTNYTNARHVVEYDVIKINRLISDILDDAQGIISEYKAKAGQSKISEPSEVKRELSDEYRSVSRENSVTTGGETACSIFDELSRVSSGFNLALASLKSPTPTIPVNPSGTTEVLPEPKAQKAAKITLTTTPIKAKVHVVPSVSLTKAKATNVVSHPTPLKAKVHVVRSVTPIKAKVNVVSNPAPSTPIIVRVFAGSGVVGASHVVNVPVPVQPQPQHVPVVVAPIPPQPQNIAAPLPVQPQPQPQHVPVVAAPILPQPQHVPFVAAPIPPQPQNVAAPVPVPVNALPQNVPAPAHAQPQPVSKPVQQKPTIDMDVANQSREAYSDNRVSSFSAPPKANFEKAANVVTPRSSEFRRPNIDVNLSYTNISASDIEPMRMKLIEFENPHHKADSSALSNSTGSNFRLPPDDVDYRVRLDRNIVESSTPRYEISLNCRHNAFIWDDRRRADLALIAI